MTTLVSSRPWTRCPQHPGAPPHQVGDTCPVCGTTAPDRIPPSGISHRAGSRS